MSACRAVFLGDSLVAGVGDPAGIGWPGRVVAAGQRAGHSITSFNRAFPGDTSYGVISHWQDEFLSHFDPAIESRVVVSFGVKDVMKYGRAGRRRAPKHLAHLLDEASPVGLPAFVVGPAPIADPDRSGDLAEISRAFASVCEERGVPYAPLFDALTDSALWSRELAAGDGVHPGADGYEFLARLVIGRGLVDWLVDPSLEPQGLPHRRFAPTQPDRRTGRAARSGNGSAPDPENR